MKRTYLGISVTQAQKGYKTYVVMRLRQVDIQPKQKATIKIRDLNYLTTAIEVTTFVRRLIEEADDEITVSTKY